jgi:hypothetical protein
MRWAIYLQERCEMLKRVIPPIGQGCCVEQVLTLNGNSVRLLYDCGSLQLKLLQHYIDSLDTSIKTVLVISHLHRDHINGVPYLIDHFKEKKRQIERRYLPFYYPEMFNLFAASIVASGTKETRDADASLIDFIFDMRDSNAVTYIHPLDNYDTNDPRQKISHDEKLLVSDFESIDWWIKFWVDSEIYDVLTSEQKKMIVEYKIDDFKDNKKSKEIKSLYKEITKNNNFNKTSMLMASFFPLKCREDDNWLLNCEYRGVINLFHKGFVCTGDYPILKQAIGKKIHDHSSGVQPLLREMMIPHHGGDKYCDYMPFDFIEKGYAQYSKNNTYKHPGNKTKTNLENWGIEFFGIQENL